MLYFNLTLFNYPAKNNLIAKAVHVSLTKIISIISEPSDRSACILVHYNSLLLSLDIKHIQWN